MKKSEPRKKIWMTTIEKKGCRYHEQVIGADAGVVGPGGEGADEFAEEQA